MKLEWNVYFYDFNANKILKKNIFDYSDFREEVVNLLNEKNNIDVFSQELRQCTMYHFWCRNEYEVNISPTANCRKDGYDELKVDFFKQLEMNWDKFVSYIWSKKEI